MARCQSRLPVNSPGAHLPTRHEGVQATGELVPRESRCLCEKNTARRGPRCGLLNGHYLSRAPAISHATGRSSGRRLSMASNEIVGLAPSKRDLPLRDLACDYVARD